MPLTADQQRIIVDNTHDWIKRASDLFSRHFDPLPVRFDLRGKSAGMYCQRAGEAWIRYNNEIFSRYFEENLAETVPHEVAHYVTGELHSRKFVRSRKIKPHGPEWRAVMESFGRNPIRTHGYDLSGIRQRTYTRFIYRCGCRAHQLTAIRHNRIRRGERHYCCQNCGEELTFAALADSRQMGK